MKQAVKKKIEALVGVCQSPSHFARSLSLGVFIACSPFLGLQTVLVFLLAPLFCANTALTFTVTYLVNNPVSLVPLLIIDYLFGKFFFEDILGISLLDYNPWFMNWFMEHGGQRIASALGVSIFSFWTFILGGVILAVLLAALAYVLSYRLFTYYYDSQRDTHETYNKQ
jgi:uncharacterized protein (DUF2062 family)